MLFACVHRSAALDERHPGGGAPAHDRDVGAPPSAVGVIIAVLVLGPEALAAYRNARRGRVQTSFNLALGSAMASIGLTIPAIAVASIWLEGPLVLGLGATQMVLLFITVVVNP
jgi:Ca2+:H+ antiporter